MLTNLLAVLGNHLSTRSTPTNPVKDSRGRSKSEHSLGVMCVHGEVGDDSPV